MKIKLIALGKLSLLKKHMKLHLHKLDKMRGKIQTQKHIVLYTLKIKAQ